MENRRAERWRDRAHGTAIGSRVRVVTDGPHRGREGEVTSVLADGGETYWQVRLPDAVGLFTEWQIELLYG